MYVYITLFDVTAVKHTNVDLLPGISSISLTPICITMKYSKFYHHTRYLSVRKDNSMAHD
jgi:hypothetical protein